MYSYDEVYNETLEYFDGDELAAKVFVDKYALKDNDGNFLEKSPEMMHRRIAKEFARIQKNKFQNPLTEDEIFYFLKDFKYIVPAGSPMYGIGNEFQIISLSNCFLVETPLDSYSSILKADEQFANICKRRGGVGICLDNLRPAGSPTMNAAKTSTGILSFMERFSNTIKEVGQCIASGEKVLTYNGLVNIEDVKIGNKVWTKIGWVNVTNNFMNGKKKIFKLTTKKGYEIKTTNEHIFLKCEDSINERISETKLKDFKIGDDIVLIPGISCNENNTSNLHFSEYEKNEYNNSNRLNEEVTFPEKIDEKMAYVLGYMYGDGYIDKDRSGNICGFSLSTSHDHPLIENKLKKYIKDLFNYDVNVKSGEGKYNVLQVFSKIIVNNLNNNDLLKEKCGNLLFPGKIIKNSSFIQSAFISGYFDADGCSQKSKKVYKIASIDLQFVKMVQTILIANGIVSTIHKENREKQNWKDIYNLCINGTFAQNKFINFMKESVKVQGSKFVSSIDHVLTIFKSNDFSLNRGTASYCPSKSQFLTTNTYQKLIDENFIENKKNVLIIDKIISIEECGYADTYDLELEKEHLFWCNGFYVHNSGRRGASMQLLSVHHPQILDFATVKNDDKRVTGSNISVKLSNEFLEAVKNDTEYELRFPVDYKERNIEPKVSEMVKARDVWNKIIHSAWLRAEPGLLFWDNITTNTPADCYDEYKSKGTNPCSELNLSELDSCRLISMNTFSFVDNPFTPEARFNFEKFYEYSKVGQRLMDDLVDLESEKVDKIIAKIEADPEPDYIKFNELRTWKIIKKHNDEGRRTGLGMLGIGDTLAALGIKYGCEESIEVVEEIAKTLKLAAYRESVDIAKELSPFKDYDYTKEENHPFIQRIAEEDPTLYEDMMKYGRRNISLTTLAPTGSISIEARTSSGLEPLFNISFTRRKKINDEGNERVDFIDQEGTKWQNFEVLHPKVKMWSEITGETDLTKSPWYDCTADKIDWINRVKLQGAIQKHICHSISSTINLPKNVSEEIVNEIYLSAWEYGLKGITVYRDGCRSGVLVNDDDNDEREAVKRPKEVHCEIYHTNVTKKLDKVRTFKYMVMIGVLEGEPYEIFALENGQYKHSHGKIIRRKRGHYDLEFENGELIQNFTKETTENEDALTRMVSTGLRHNVPIHFICEQLNKVEGELFCFSKSLARSLKKFIKDGTKSTENCSNCGSKLFYENGCYVCKNCGESKCS